MIRLLLAALILAMCCTGALASVGLEPASGYVHLPDAQVVPAGRIVGYAGYVSTKGTNELGRVNTMMVPCDGNGFAVGAIGGLGKGMELGAGITGVDKSVGRAGAFAAAFKWRLSGEKAGYRVALGATYRRWNTDMAIAEPPSNVISLDLPAITSVYLVADKDFTPCAGSIKAVTGTLGVIYESYSSSHLSNELDLPFFNPSIPVSLSGCVSGDSFVSPFIGVRVEAAKWGILGEFRPKLEADRFSYQSALWSIAVNRRIGESAIATAGVSTYNLPYTVADPAFFFEVAYQFGKR